MHESVRLDSVGGRRISQPSCCFR